MHDAFDQCLHRGAASLPSLPPKEGPHRPSALGMLRSAQARYGIAAVSLFFMGRFSLLTYLRPFLETITNVNVSTLSLILLIVGGAGLLGTYLIGFALKTQLRTLLIGMPIALAAMR
jgi:predicted MFS family arabinose efflux permease